MAALHLATFAGPDRTEIARLLLSHGADATLRDADGRTPLDWADKQNPRIAALIRASGKR